MDSSQIYGVTEECNSCESGWTMYIGSPIHGDDGGDDDNEYSDDGDNDDDGADNKNYNHEDDSDDSMASDASSGPSHQGMAHFKRKEDKRVGKYRLEKKDNKSLEKQKADTRRKEEKEEKVFVEKKAKAPAQSVSKVRKSIWMGKRK